jgi:lysophospholipase L1-like esterase
MLGPRRLLVFPGILSAFFLFLVDAAAAQEKPSHTAISPLPRDQGWLRRHNAFVEIAKKGNIDVLFLGDSITDGWGGDGHSKGEHGTRIFTEEFLPLKTANFGISGDRTQHVLWRLQNGELDGIKPKVVMLMIGTNNSNGTDNTADEIADGIGAIVKEIHKRSPATKVLLLGVFPRGERANAQREKIQKVNELVAKLDDGGKTVKYLDIGKKLMQPDGTISKEIMHDYLHLTEKGYQVWADAVKGPIKELLAKNQ